MTATEVELGKTSFHAMTPAEVFEKFATSPEGLSTEQARQRHEKYGPNRLKPPQQKPAIVRLLLQFHNVLIYILIAAAVITALLGHWIDTGVILAVVIINGLIGFIQESKAEKALESIRNMLSLEASVLRDGKRQTVPAEELVPGDVVLLESGDKVPADLRLFRVRDLRIDESLLTGESVPVEKTTEPLDEKAGLGDRTNMAFSGAIVSAGQGRGVVVAIAEHTEIGRISTMVSQVEQITTPLLRQVASFGKLLSIIIVALAAGTFALGTLVWGRDTGDTFMASVGLAVAAIPEGLPAILTITLAIGVRRMAYRHAIIRNLPAVDTLGSVTVICSDKTGTLTRNEQTVTTVITPQATLEVTGTGYEPKGTFKRDGSEIQPDQVPGLLELARVGMLCNDSTLRQESDQWIVQGDPVDGALLTLAMKAGLDQQQLNQQHERLDAIPFESEHKFMATLNRDGEATLICVKGAPEKLIALSNADATQWKKHAEELAAKGQRVLAIASKKGLAGQSSISMDDIKDLQLLGLVGMIDPPRPEAIQAIAECRSAGIRVKMITGDHALTAKVIGMQMGIGDGEHVLTGSGLDDLDEAALRKAVEQTDVFARVSPEHKLRLVQAVQANGNVVAMTGDGVNDAPALKRADVGVAMGIKGTEASKEAADMVLTDDNFASIAHAVEEGRTVYTNLRKAILYILPTNGGQTLAIMAAVLINLTLPVTPVQILWVNMITAVTLALALAFEPPEPDVMKQPPRRVDQPLLDGFFAWRILFVSLLLCGGTFGLFLWEYSAHDDLALARTLAVNTLVMMQVFYVFNTRFIDLPVIHPRDLTGNRYLLGAVGLVILFQAAFTYLPWMQRLFDTRPLSLHHWLWIIPCGLAVYVLVEVEKTVIRRSRQR